MTQKNPPAGVERLTRVMFTRIIASLARALAEEEFSVAHIAALHLLDEEGTMRVAALAEALGRSPSGTSRLLDVLVQRDLVSRVEDPEDRRAKKLALTAAGARFVQRVGDERVRVMREVVSSWPGAAKEGFFKTLLSDVLREKVGLGSKK